MLRLIQGTNFMIGSFVDAMTPENQRVAGVLCALKATHQQIKGQSELRYDFHHANGYYNLPFQDDGSCDVGPGQSAFHSARDWMQGAESIVKSVKVGDVYPVMESKTAVLQQQGKVLVHSWSGIGKAIRLVAAHLCGWVRTQYKESLERVYRSADIPKTLRVDLPAFEAALLDSMDAGAAQENVKASKVGPDGKPAKAKRKARKPKRPQLD